MNEETRLISLVQEVAEYRRTKNYRGCIKKMDSYEIGEENPQIKVCISIAKATCALQIGDYPSARNALNAINRRTLSGSELIYFDLVLVTLLQEEGQAAEAKLILQNHLAQPELRLSEHREALSEMLARMGFALADLEEFDSSIKFLNDSLEMMMADDELRGTVYIYLGYCLQSKGHLAEAREYFSRVINEGIEDVVADAYYRLGGLHLQRCRYDLAIAMFKKAEISLPNGKISLKNILLAESDAFRANGQLDLARDAMRRSRQNRVIQ